MMWGIDRVNWILGLLMMVLFWGGLVVLVVFALRGRDASQRRDGGGANSSDARSILDERFARGEVSEDEFEQKRRVLEHATH